MHVCITCTCTVCALLIVFQCLYMYSTCIIILCLFISCDGFILSLFFRFYQSASVRYTHCAGCTVDIDCDCYRSFDSVHF